MEELRKSYKSGIVSLILIATFFVLLSSLIYINNTIAVFMINIVSFIVLILIFGFYFKMMIGYVHIGEKYSKSLKRATYGIMGCIILFLLLFVLLYFASIENTIYFFNGIAILLFIGYVVFGILKIVSGVSIYNVPVKSNTKTTLSIFSMLYGISMITVVGGVFLPYIKIMEFVFEILFLKDTYKKDHEDKKKRNLWIWIVSLIVYLLLVGVLGYLFYEFIMLWREFL